jgi:hypothetical protein
MVKNVDRWIQRKAKDRAGETCRLGRPHIRRGSRRSSAGGVGKRPERLACSRSFQLVRVVEVRVAGIGSQDAGEGENRSWIWGRCKPAAASEGSEMDRQGQSQ